MLIEPRATYRIQLNSNVGFDAAAEIVPYLSDLGISHLYCTAFRPVTNPTRELILPTHSMIWLEY